MTSINQMQQKCKIHGCNGLGKKDKTGNRLYVRGLCVTHYSRYVKGIDLHADTRFTKRNAVISGAVAYVPIGANAKDGYAIVDKGYAWVDKYQWHLNNKGYPTARIQNKLIMMHHTIFGKPQAGLVTDHVNRNKKDNRISNLRHTTQSANTVNGGRIYKNSIGEKNISFAKRRGAFLVRIVRGSEVVFRGVFDSLPEAIMERDKFLVHYRRMNTSR